MLRDGSGETTSAVGRSAGRSVVRLDPLTYIIRLNAVRTNRGRRWPVEKKN